MATALFWCGGQEGDTSRVLKPLFFNVLLFFMGLGVSQKANKYVGGLFSALLTPT